MTKQDFYRQLELITETAVGGIQGTENLRDLDGWDSLAIISFIAMTDQELGQTAGGEQISKCRTISDLVALFPEKIKD